MSLKATCLVCVDDNEEPRTFKVSEKEISMAISHKPETGGNALIACSHCGTVYALPSDLPNTVDGLKEWIAQKEEQEQSCCPCLPLEGIVALEPVGRFEFPPRSGRFLYKPAGAQSDEDYPDGFSRRVYMFRFGLDPAVAWKLMHIDARVIS